MSVFIATCIFITYRLLITTIIPYPNDDKVDDLIMNEHLQQVNAFATAMLEALCGSPSANLLGAMNEFVASLQGNCCSSMLNL